MAKRGRIFCGALTAALAIGAIAAASAGADVTIGQVLQGSSPPGACPITGDGFVVASSDNLNPYSVPAGGGEITQWSTSWGTSGTMDTLVVLQPIGFGFELVDWDSEPFPASTANHVATFTLSTPIAVAAGDSIGLFAKGSDDVPCEFAAASPNQLGFISAALGHGVIFTDGTTLVAEPDELPNVDAVVTQSADLALSAPTSETAVASGAIVDFSVSATTAGASEAATVTDTLSSGLKPLAAAVGAVACSLSGQTFTCPVTGEPATISVVASAATSGTATNTATIAGSLSDPDAANNSAATLVVVSAPAVTGPSATAPPAAAPSVATCSLAPLAGIRLALAQTIVSDLGCKDGSVTRHSSKKVPKGEVISTTPAGPTSLTAGAAVDFTVSSGKPVKHKHSAKPKSKR